MNRTIPRRPIPILTHNRFGISMVEVLVSIAIVGILFAISVQAVQSARAVARKSQCANNLRQIGIALTGAAEQDGLFPTDRYCFVKLMPFLDMQEAYDAHRNMTLRPPLNVPWMECPEEGNHAPGIAQPSYMVNDGSRFRRKPPGHSSDNQQNGFRSANREGTRPSEFSDGLSNTAAFSERIHTPQVLYVADSPVAPQHYLWYTEQRFLEPGTESQAIEQCRSHRTSPDPVSDSLHKVGLELNDPGYDHFLPPNQIGCYNGPNDFEFQAWHSLIPPTSHHAGGVNVLFADGAVHFIHSGISTDPWHAMGSRDANDLVTF
ncbi:DUF1559 domain-containing protein [Thalassoglobus sp. JC818]|uniref:DUF1559 family PulG-like putative transporter n=1 Tax=Thalassoglobus sp. JC818 TaxID=3232136 RepID=UPI0034598D14